MGLQVRDLELSRRFSDEPDALCDDLRDAGLPIAQPRSDGPFGLMSMFVDPDGYTITAHEQGGEG